MVQESSGGLLAVRAPQQGAHLIVCVCASRKTGVLLCLGVIFNLHAHFSQKIRYVTMLSKQRRNT